MNITPNCARRLTLKLKKSNIFQTKDKWFGRVFSSTGVSASPDNINIIAQAGGPNTMEEVRSLLQTCYFNVKFTFNRCQGRS